MVILSHRESELLKKLTSTNTKKFGLPSKDSPDAIELCALIRKFLEEQPGKPTYDLCLSSPLLIYPISKCPVNSKARIMANRYYLQTRHRQ